MMGAEVGMRVGSAVGVDVVLANIGALLVIEVGPLLGERVESGVDKEVGKGPAEGGAPQPSATLISTSAQFQN